MGTIAFIAKNWRLLLGAVLAIGLGIGGFWLKGVIAKAEKVDALTSVNKMLQTRHEFDTREQARIEGEKQKLSADLDAARKVVQVDVQTVIKKIPILVPDKRDCDISPATVKELNRAMGYGP
jgi:hypothetical protein